VFSCHPSASRDRAKLFFCFLYILPYLHFLLVRLSKELLLEEINLNPVNLTTDF